MERLFAVLPAVAALAMPQLASAQSSDGNNPLKAGVYVEGIVGANFQDETDLDFVDDDDDASVDPEAGVLLGLSAGYNLPLGLMNLRFEGEFSGRVNEVDEIEESVSGDVVGLENAEISSTALLANAHLDFYVLPNLALTVGSGIGFAYVDLDLAVINDDTYGFAYQGRAGLRYSFSQNTTLSLGYTYFATNELEVDDTDGDEVSFDYTNHGVHLGVGYHF